MVSGLRACARNDPQLLAIICGDVFELRCGKLQHFVPSLFGCAMGEFTEKNCAFAALDWKSCDALCAGQRSVEEHLFEGHPEGLHSHRIGISRSKSACNRVM